MKIKKGDTVIVISGNEKGKTGKVLEVLSKKDRVIIENVNMIVKHQKPNPRNNTGGRIEMEAPLHISNVMYYDSENKKGTRIQYKRLEDGRKVRVMVSSGKMID